MLQDLVAIDDIAAIDGHFVGFDGGFGAGGDDDEFGFEFARSRCRFRRGGECGSTKFCDAMNDVDAVALELVLGDADLVFDHALHAETEIAPW